MADLRSELLAVREEYGVLTPQVLVEAATPEDHPLHSRFEWDDAEAAYAHRLHQARQLIRIVKVGYRDDETGEQKHVRFFHAIPAESGERANIYQTVDEVIADPVATRVLMAMMARDWRALKTRYDRFAEFSEMVRRDMDSAQQK